MIDTHTHLYLPEFDPEPTSAVDRAIEAGVDYMIFPNVDCDTVGPMRRLNSARPQNTFMAMGLHPTEVNGDWQSALEAIKDELLLNIDDYVAIGEVGIDLYWDTTYREQQRKALREQAEWASKLSLPLIIHSREGLNDVLDIVGGVDGIGNVIFHSFAGNADDVARISDVIEYPWFGINGVVTFKNSKLREVLPAIGTRRILLETDAPYLTPVPHRGKRNESAYLRHTAAHIAEALGLAIEEVDRITTSNALKAFPKMEQKVSTKIICNLK